VGVARARGVHRHDGGRGDEAEREASLVVPGPGHAQREDAAPGSGPDDDAGPPGPPGQPAGRLNRVRYFGEQGGLALVAAIPVAAAEHRVQDRRGDVRDQRTGVQEQQHAGREPGGPGPQDRARLRRDQPVTGYVDGVARPQPHRIPRARRAERLGAQAGNERALAARLDQGHVEAGVRVRIRGAQDGDALGLQCVADLVAPRPGAVPARVHHGQALPRGGGHNVEASAHLDG